MAPAGWARGALVALVFLASIAGVTPLPRGGPHALRHASRSHAMTDDDHSQGILIPQWTSPRGARGALRLPCRGMLRLSGGRGRPQHRSPSVDHPPVPVRSNSWNWLVHGGGKEGEAAQTRKVVLAVSFYFFTSLSLTFLNKCILTQFPFPLFVTAFQLVVAWAMLWAFGWAGQYCTPLAFAPPPEFDLSVAAAVLPVTVLYVGMLSMTNYCLRFVDVSFYQLPAFQKGCLINLVLYVRMLSMTNFCLRFVDVSFYQILRSLVIPFNIVTSFLVLGLLPQRNTLLCCGIVMAGFTLGSASELNFTWEGFASGCLSSLFMALYSTFVKAILPSVGGSTWRLMHYTTIIATLIVSPLVVLSGEYAQAVVSPNFATPLFWKLMSGAAVFGLLTNITTLMSGAAVFGFLINLAYFALIKHGSPLTTHIAACAKSALQTALSVAIFRNTVTASNALGILLTLAGSAMYEADAA
ncbi:hypothetical protein T484DRAFT_1914717 [Baffinella frigidus]|nr:hypothetical protein T484DRAFT_1914717 [Cryptophyta sp. CCMP2293]